MRTRQKETFLRLRFVLPCAVRFTEILVRTFVGPDRRDVRQMCNLQQHDAGAA